MEGKQDPEIDDTNVKSNDSTTAQHPTPPSSSFTAFQLKHYKELCVSENDLPSSSIADLWQKPLNDSFTNSKTPIRRRKAKSQQTPTNRRNILPPTKLTFDNMDSNESPSKRKAGYRRSLSYPEPGSCISSNFDTSSYQAKRIRYSEESSPYEDFVRGNSSNQTSTKGIREQLFDSSSSSLTPVVKRLFLNKSQSDSILSSCNIKTALERLDSNPALIGDGTKSHQLPFKADGKHCDLKEIEVQTLADLVENKDQDQSVMFRIIDCRYPYEYNGGHIKGVENLYTRSQIYNEFIERKTVLPTTTTQTSSKSRSDSKENMDPSREVLIFHCEFSSHRAPSLCRYLRDADRAANATSYPSLHYPEMYVLFGGYKEFFNKFEFLCDPQDYTTMDDPKYAEEYKKFKSESKLAT